MQESKFSFTCFICSYVQQKLDNFSLPRRVIAKLVTPAFGGVEHFIREVREILGGFNPPVNLPMISGEIPLSPGNSSITKSFSYGEKIMNLNPRVNCIVVGYANILVGHWHASSLWFTRHITWAD